MCGHQGFKIVTAYVCTFIIYADYIRGNTRIYDEMRIYNEQYFNILFTDATQSPFLLFILLKLCKSVQTVKEHVILIKHNKNINY